MSLSVLNLRMVNYNKLAVLLVVILVSLNHRPERIYGSAELT